MKAIVLAAGYAVRLRPLTLNRPKPLLEVAGKSIIEYAINKLEELEIVDKIYIITNDKFSQNFGDWLINFNSKKPIEIVNDGTKSNDDRLGALGDIHYILNTKKISEDIIVIASDNIFDFSLQDVTNLFTKIKSNIIVLHDVKDLELAKKYGVVAVEKNVVVSFEEKPIRPRSTLISTGIYIFPKKTLPLIKEYVDQGNNPDKTGDFIGWLYKKDEVYSYSTDQVWYDIGSFEQLEKANKHYKG